MSSTEIIFTSLSFLFPSIHSQLFQRDPNGAHTRTINMRLYINIYIYIHIYLCASFHKHLHDECGRPALHVLRLNLANKGFRVRRRRRRHRRYKVLIGVRNFNRIFNDNTQGPANHSTALNGWFPTLGFGGPMGYVRLEKIMDDSLTAQTLREASLWWKDTVSSAHEIDICEASCGISWELSYVI